MYSNFRISAEEWEQGKRPLLDDWPLYRDPLSVALILVAYAAFVLYLGPKFMKSRKPYNLKYVIILYNAVQVLYNSWIFLRVSLEPSCWKHFFQFACVETTPQKEYDLQMLMCLTFWHLTVNKLMDLLDTVFFVLRKKQSHVTFLHVQHHILTISMIWIIGKYFTGVEGGVAFCCNSIVHIVMYLYYLVAALGPEYKKYLWWKKYLTILQIIQFVLIITYLLAALGLACGFNHAVVWLLILDAVLNLALFMKFYYDTYNSKKLISDKIAMCSSLQFSTDYMENHTDINQSSKKDM